jgi:hypothetical protein
MGMHELNPISADKGSDPPGIDEPDREGFERYGHGLVGLAEMELIRDPEGLVLIAPAFSQGHAVRLRPRGFQAG